MAPSVGIDLGTTNSAIGILDNDKVRLFPNPLGELLTRLRWPSIRRAG